MGLYLECKDRGIGLRAPGLRVWLIFNSEALRLPVAIKESTHSVSATLVPGASLLQGLLASQLSLLPGHEPCPDRPSIPWTRLIMTLVCSSLNLKPLML